MKILPSFTNHPLSIMGTSNRSGVQRQSPTPPGAIELKIGRHGCSI